MTDQSDRSTVTRRNLLKKIALASGALVIGGTAFGSPAAARGPRGGGGVGFITDVGWDKLNGGTDPFEFTGRQDLPNWFVPKNCRHPDDQPDRANNVQVRNVNTDVPLGLLLPWDRDVPEPGSGPYIFHNPTFDCGTSRSDSRDRELIRVNFKPWTPRGPP